MKCALDAKKYNTFQLKDPTKKPVILYLTMENSIQETINRIWANCFGNFSQMKDFEPAEAARMLEEAQVFTPSNPHSPELYLMYKSNKSINTNDLRGIIEDFEKDGKEVVFLVFDYLKRIRSVNPNKEIRLELGQVTDELASIAKEYEIPVLTANQLNREAFRAMEQAESFEQKMMAAERMGASNVGESIDVIQNCDIAFILNKLSNVGKSEDTGEIEYVDRFLSVKLIASRTKQPQFTSFKHRFLEGNDMNLADDISGPVSTSIIGSDTLAVKKGKVVGNGKRTIVDNTGKRV